MKIEKNVELAIKAVEIALEKKADNPVILDISELTTITDCFVILTGFSKNQNKAIADGIKEGLKEDKKTLRIQGYDDATWIVMDYMDIVIHIFEEKLRLFYDLEGLWGDGKRIEIPLHNVCP